jgi:branched-chain amino acid transport system permease protein
MNKIEAMSAGQPAKDAHGTSAPASATGTLKTALPLIVGAIALIAPLLSTSTFYVHLAVLICLNIVIVNGLSILNRTGQLSFCHAAFMGLGAFTSVLATTRLGMPFLVSVALGTMAAALGAFLLGSVILRLRGVYFVLITFAFGELFRLALLEGATLTGGANGISGIPPAAILDFAFDSKKSFYCLAAVLAVASVAFVVLLFKTPKGHSLNAVGDNPQLAEASGLSVQKTQLFAFTLGSAMAGIGGAFLASYVGYVSPESFATHVSIAAIIMLVVGGRNSVYGPVIGALVMTSLPELFRGAVQTQNIFYGVTLIVILRFLPEGLASLSAVIKTRGAAKGGAR